MKNRTKAAVGLLAAGTAWAIHRRRKYPLAKGYPFVNLAALPKALVSGKFAAFGNFCLRKRGVVHPSAGGVMRRSVEIPSEDGGRIALTIYEAPFVRGRAPCLVYFHGGGFCFSDAGYIHKNVMDYVRIANCKAVFVHYRTADRYAFPTPFTDCRAALRYVWDHSASLGVDRGRIAVGGDSAGGALAAACTLWARDRTEIRILFQMLLYPVTDLRMETASMRKYTDSPLWNAKLNRNMWRLYLRNGVFGFPAYAAPMLAADFTGLPKAYVEVEEFDCLHDEGVAYGRALRRAGVDVHLEDVKGTFHGFDVFRQAAKTREMIALRGRVLYEAFWKPASGRK